MENIQIILYGFIQGITEFLPVSSSAHLYIIQEVYSWEEKGLILVLGAHLGTLLAVLFNQRKKIIFLNKNKKNNFFSQSNLFFIALIACFPVVFIGALVALLNKTSYTSNLLIIAIASILGGVLLEISDNYKNRKKNKKSINYRQALIIGCFQTLAIIPGMSRSGSVITAMRFLGMERTFSINFSLLTSIPVLVLACSYSIYQVFFNYHIFIMQFSIIVLVSFITALLSIKFFLLWVKLFSFRVFSVYRIFLGLCIIVYLAFN